jgi:hypothetical protein
LISGGAIDACGAKRGLIDLARRDKIAPRVAILAHAKPIFHTATAIEQQRSLNSIYDVNYLAQQQTHNNTSGRLKNPCLNIH